MTTLDATSPVTGRVIEQFLLGKNTDDSLCEDAIVVTDAFAVVLDGATDISGATFDGVSGGRFAAQTLAGAVACLPADATARSAVDYLAHTLRSAARESNQAGSEPTCWPTATLLMYSAAHRQVWRVGDGHARIGEHTILGVKRIDDVTIAYRRAWNAAELAAGSTPADIKANDPGFAAMWPLIAKQDSFANAAGTPYAYGVINGSRVPDVLIERFDVDDECDVVLASDGYLTELGTLADAEAELAEALAADPLGESRIARCVRPTWRSFDDRAYVRLVA